MERLFLYVSPCLVSTQWIAPIVQPNPSHCLISSRVTSGSFSTSRLMRSPCSGSSSALRPQNRYLGLKSPVRFLCAKSFFTIPSET
jgi:DNA-binding transcriptional regulator YdaS (Cro superfamily)